MFKEIILSTGKICPKCGCESLEECFPIPSRPNTDIAEYDKHYDCVAGCGMGFGLKRLINGKIKIGYDKGNEEYLKNRFKFLEEEK